MIYVIFILPLMAIVIGYVMVKYPPKKINIFVGYRTFNSMKNQETWKFANQYCGKLWIKTGITELVITCLLSVLVYLNYLPYTETILTIVVLCETVVMLLPIFIVEKKLKTINSDGCDL